MAKVANTKRSVPKEELAARLSALSIEYFAAPAAIRAKIRQQARERRRAAMMALAARQKQERLAAAFWRHRRGRSSRASGPNEA
jgi:hypothetical protein